MSHDQSLLFTESGSVPRFPVFQQKIILGNEGPMKLDIMPYFTNSKSEDKRTTQISYSEAFKIE